MQKSKHNLNRVMAMLLVVVMLLGFFPEMPGLVSSANAADPAAPSSPAVTFPDTIEFEGIDNDAAGLPYEKNADGSFKKDSDGNKIPKLFNLPDMSDITDKDGKHPPNIKGNDYTRVSI